MYFTYANYSAYGASYSAGPNACRYYVSTTPALRHCSTAKNFSVRNKKYFKLCINMTYWLSKIVESVAVTAFGAVLELLKNIKLTYPLNFAVLQCRPAERLATTAFRQHRDVYN